MERLHTGELEELEYASTVMNGWRTITAKNRLRRSSYLQAIWVCAYPSVRKEGRFRGRRARWRLTFRRAG